MALVPVVCGQVFVVGRLGGGCQTRRAGRIRKEVVDRAGFPPSHPPSRLKVLIGVLDESLVTTTACGPAFTSSIRRAKSSFDDLTINEV
jgi:hypothetical protein